jgi:hypothetical protein
MQSFSDKGARKSFYITSFLQAYTQKKRFVVLMYGGFLEAQRMVERLFLVPRLVSPAWHLCLKVSKVYGSNICGIPGAPEDVAESIPCPLSSQPSLAPLPQGE